MISAKRMVHVFQICGGCEAFYGRDGNLTAEELTHLSSLVEGEPIAARVSAKDDWFVLTQTQLVVQQHGTLSRVALRDIRSASVSRSELLLNGPRLKVDGGHVDVGLRDGSSLRIKVTPGKAFMGLWNVLIYVAKVTGSPSGRGLTFRKTNDERPTTAL
jgi:hypothetical protein